MRNLAMLFCFLGSSCGGCRTGGTSLDADGIRDVTLDDGMETLSEGHGSETCLGAEHPIQMVENLRVEDVGGVCPVSDWISGIPVATPSGGWLVSDAPTVCCTDTGLLRVVALGPDLNIRWIKGFWAELLSGKMTPTLVGILADSWVVWEGGGNAGGGKYWGRLMAFSYEGTAKWDLDLTECCSAHEASQVVRPAFPEQAWFLTVQHAGDGVSRFGLMRLDETGDVVASWKVEGLHGSQWSVISHEDGIAVTTVMREDKDGFRRDIVEMGGVTWDGDVWGPMEVGRWESNLDSYLLVQLRELTRSILIEASWVTEKNMISEETVRVSTDGQIIWRHTGPWSLPSGPGSLPEKLFEQKDRSILVLGQVASSTKPGISLVFRGRVPADGQVLEVLGPEIPDPLGLDTSWDVVQWHRLEDGLVALAWVSVPAVGTQAVVARYRGFFEELRWSHAYPLEGSPKALIRNDSEWLLALERMREPSCDGFGNLKSPALTLLRFEGVCP